MSAPERLTVVEAEDWTQGYLHVAAAIGQASLYATQIAMTGWVKPVRRAVHWSAMGYPARTDSNDLMKEVCRRADVTPICIGLLKQQLWTKLRHHLLFTVWNKPDTSWERCMDSLVADALVGP